MESELYVGEQKIRFDRDATAALYRDTVTTPGAGLTRKLALPAPDGPHNQIESKPAIEVIDVVSDALSQ